MSENTHIIPVGFDRDRLVAPVAEDENAGKAYILRDPAGTEGGNAEFAHNIAELVERDLRVLANLQDEDIILQGIDIHDYESAYHEAFDLVQREVDSGNGVSINISSMPRTVSFAFATAANHLVLEDPDRRKHINVFYTPPEEYLVNEVRSLLSEIVEEISSTLATRDEENLESTLERVLDECRTMADEISNYGMTKGAAQVDGGHKIEIPPTPTGPLRDFEKKLLETMADRQNLDSVTSLAEALVEEGEGELKSIKSKVVYNTRTLEGKGYVELESQGRKQRPRLTRTGKLWTETDSNRNTGDRIEA